MSAMASHITNLAIVYSTVYLGADQKTSKLRGTGLCVGISPVTGEFPHKRPVTRKWFSFNDVIGKLVSPEARIPTEMLFT